MVILTKFHMDWPKNVDFILFSISESVYFFLTQTLCKKQMNISSYLRYLNYHFYYACAEIFLQVSRSWHLTFSTLEAGTGKTLRHDMTVNRILPTFETCLKFSRSCTRISSLYLSLDLCTMNWNQWFYFEILENEETFQRFL